MNELTTWNGKSLELVDLAPSQRLEVEGIIRAEEDIAGGFIKLGGHLCRLKNMCPHGMFEALAEKYCRLGASQRQNAMKVYREFAEKPNRLGFSATVLIELTRAEDPQAALAEAESRAEAGETISVKAAREIAAAQKRAEEAEAKTEAVQLELVDMKRRAEAAEAQTKPDQSRLIRELMLKRKSGDISEAQANAFSMLPEVNQRVILETLRRGDAINADRDAAQKTAAQAVAAQQEALAEAKQARAEADEAKRRADEIARDGAQLVIDDLRAENEALKKRIDRERETAWEEGRKTGIAQKNEAGDKAAADLLQKVAALEKEKNALSRKLSGAENTMESMRQERRMLEARANGLQEQMEAAHPVAKDNIHAQVIAHMAEDLKAEIAKLEADCEPHQRKLSDAALEALAAVADGYLDRQNTMLIEG